MDDARLSPHRINEWTRTVLSPLGAQHFLNPKNIPEPEDFVALSRWGRLAYVLAAAACVFGLFFGLYLAVDGIEGIGEDYARRAFALATNPIMGLLFGVACTALLQSSSTTTALTIAAVGTSVVSVEAAVPIIMGANLGTTVTPLLISLFYSRSPGYQRVMMTASLHAWLNGTFVLLLLPIELLFHPLQTISGALGRAIAPADSVVQNWNFHGLFFPLIDAIGSGGLIGNLMAPQAAGTVCLLLGAVLALTSIHVMSTIVRVLFAATTQTLLEKLFGAKAWAGFTVGLLGTMIFQASAVAISTMLPFSATRTLGRKEVLTLILGINVGTTFGGVVTALALPGPFSVIGMQAALVHVLFNVTAVIVVTALRPLRRLLFAAADFSADLGRRLGPWRVLVMLIAAYLVVPGLLFLAGWAL